MIMMVSDSHIFQPAKFKETLWSISLNFSMKQSALEAKKE